MTLLLCVKPGWLYPGNICENAPRAPEFHEYPPLKGNCSEPKCDVVEFFHQAALLHIGMKPSWLSEYMPDDKKKVDKMLSGDFKFKYR